MIEFGVLKILVRAWAAPYSALGLLLGLAMVLGGGRMQIRQGAIEFGGGRLGRLASRLPRPLCFSAITLGHVILGTDQAALAEARAHEQVHVRQYERWGILFVPAYLLSSLVQLALGRRPYRDNRFEREAYAQGSGATAACVTLPGALSHPHARPAAMRETTGFYERRVFPWLNDRLGADPALERIRADGLADARGRVVEIGFGTGLNLRHYPAAVQGLVAVEPNPGMHERAHPRIAQSRIPVELVMGRAENLPLPDASFDTAVAVLTLCTVSDPARVLAELRRVLRNDGRLLLIEHGLSGDPGVARWQNRLNGLQRTFACGCNLNRSVPALVEASGFRFQTLRQLYVPKVPRTHGWLTIGTAVKTTPRQAAANT